MKIVIFGASGFSGTAILKEALVKNHQVTLLVRNKSAISTHHKNLTVMEGNVMDRKVVTEVLKNHDATIQCLGINGKGTGKHTTFISDATKIIVEEMQKQGVKRLLAMSNAGAGNSIAFQPWIFTKIILPFFMTWLKAIIDDKNRMEPVIMNSPLDWTIIRCPNIVDRPSKGSYYVTLDGKGLKPSVTLGDMATCIIHQLADSTFSRKAPSVSN